MSPEDSLLLLLRWARARGATLTDEAPGLTKLIEQLEGFPLLIERAAALLGSYEPSRLSERIEHDPLRVLFGTKRLRVLQQSVWGAARPSAQRAAQALSTFAGPFTAAAAIAVLDCEEDAAHRLLGALLRHAIVHERLSGEARQFQLYAPHRWLARSAAEREGRWQLLCGRHAQVCAHAIETSAADKSLIVERAASHGPNSPVWGSTLSIASKLVSGPRSLQQLERLAAQAQRPDDRVLLALGRAEQLRSADRIQEALEVLEQVGSEACSPLLCAQRLEESAILCRKLRRFDAAIGCAEQAARLYRAVEAPRLARALGALGAVLVESGEHERALEQFEEVERLAGKAGDANAALLAIGYRGHAHQERGALERAVEAYRTASEGLMALGDSRLAGIYWGYGGTALEELGRVEEARAHYDRAVSMLEAQGATSFCALFEACRNALTAQPAALRPPALEDPALLAAIELHHLRANLDHERRAHVPPIARSLALREVSDDVRFAVRRLAAVRARGAPSGAAVLRVGRACLQLGDAAIDLTARRVLFRLVEHLIASHVMAPGRGVPKHELVRAAWGDERMLPQAAAHRLRVALSELRSKGLAGILLRSDDGVAFEPALVISYDAHLMRASAAPMPSRAP